MKERPIIFSPESVRGILEERKTQTRRVITPQPHPENPLPFSVKITEPSVESVKRTLGQ